MGLALGPMMVALCPLTHALVLITVIVILVSPMPSRVAFGVKRMEAELARALLILRVVWQLTIAMPIAIPLELPATVVTP